MKYLNSFNEKIRHASDHNMYDIMQDIKDICLELNDIGFVIKFVEAGYTVIKFEIQKENYSSFSYDEVSEVMERIKDYMPDTFTTDIKKYVKFPMLNLLRKVSVKCLYYLNYE